MSDKLPTRGLTFLGYWAPWLLVGIGLYYGTRSTEPNWLILGIILAFSVPTALAVWYGVSRRRTWGWWLVLVLFALNPTLDAVAGDYREAVYGLIGFVLWAIYLAKRRDMFRPKPHAVALQVGTDPREARS